MFLFGGANKKETKKVGPEFTERVKAALKPELCLHCHKTVPNKVVFGNGVQACLTCNNCELKAVGGNIKKLGENNLIAVDKFTGLVTS